VNATHLRVALAQQHDPFYVAFVRHTEKEPRYTLSLDRDLFNEITHSAGLLTERAQAEALRLDRGFLNRVRNGRAAPGPEFIAQVRVRFPAVDTNRLFPIVQKPAAA
jgi:hypothetical protein